MKTKILLLMMSLMFMLLISGCQRGDFQMSPVLQGQPAPHAGYNVGPDLFLMPGQPVKVTGAVIWIKGLDPTDMASLE